MPLLAIKKVSRIALINTVTKRKMANILIGAFLMMRSSIHTIDPITPIIIAGIVKR